jgi:2-C-methyl-D-erythritol 4-phosphate cytidylyltransferase
LIYAGILAGGTGKRMGYVDTPKQFLNLGGKPLIIHTLEKFLLNARFDRIYVGVVRDWMTHTEDIISKYIGQNERLTVCEGGADRNGTVMNIIRSIEETYGVREEDVIVTHDAVRPLLSHRIIEDNIDAALEAGACDTIIPATDTIVHSALGDFLDEIPDRKKIYQGQTPQSFNINLLKKCFSNLSEAEKLVLTDACKICVLQGIKVKVVLGEVYNVKITTPYDLKVANAILKEDLND